MSAIFSSYFPQKHPEFPDVLLKNGEEFALPLLWIPCLIRCHILAGLFLQMSLTGQQRSAVVAKNPLLVIFVV